MVCSRHVTTLQYFTTLYRCLKLPLPPANSFDTSFVSLAFVSPHQPKQKINMWTVQAKPGPSGCRPSISHSKSIQGWTECSTRFRLFQLVLRQCDALCTWTEPKMTGSRSLSGIQEAFHGVVPFRRRLGDFSHIVTFYYLDLDHLDELVGGESWTGASLWSDTDILEEERASRLKSFLKRLEQDWKNSNIQHQQNNSEDESCSLIRFGKVLVLLEI